MHINYGKYGIPSTIRILMDLEKELDDSEMFYKGFNFYLESGNFRYFNTPCDVIVFGNVGMDGIHYGFLTDYGAVEDLEDAPIVCVSPMSFDRPTLMIANNLRDFLAVNFTDPELFYNDFENEEEYLRVRQYWDDERENSPYQPSESDKEVRAHIISWVYKNIQIPNIHSPYQYVQSVREQRKERVAIQTQDGLGVTQPLLEGEQHPFTHVDKSVIPDVIGMREYLNSAPIASRLTLIRDIQINYVLHQEQELRKVVVASLKEMDFVDEAERLCMTI